MHLVLALIFFFLSACNAKSPDYFLAQSRAINRELLELTENIEDLDDLLAAQAPLQRLFNQLVDVMIAAHKWQIKTSVIWQGTEEDQRLCRELKSQFCRLYQIPTAKVLIEKCQETALMRLDTFERRQKRLIAK